MAVAEALISAGLARVPRPEVALAAFGAVLPVALLIASPVVPLLHAANALGYKRATRRLVFRFMLAVGVLCAGLHAAVALTPLYAVVFRDWLGLPAAVVHAARLGLIYLIPWGPAIGWRRYYQGVLIRRGATRPVGIGTGVRVVVVAIVLAAGLVLRPELGVAVGGLALTAGVVGEAVFITIAARALGEAADEGGPDLSLWRLVVFFVPLVLTNGVYILSFTVAAAELARGRLPVASLAAWPVATFALSAVQGPVTMTQQLVIARPAGVGEGPLRVFTLGVGAAAALLIALLLPAGLPFYYTHIIGVHGIVLALAMDTSAVLAALTVFMAQQQYWQGLLVRGGATLPIIVGSTANLVVFTTAGFLAATRLPWPAVDAVAGATLAGYVAELSVLAWATREERAVMRVAATGAGV